MLHHMIPRAWPVLTAAAAMTVGLGACTVRTFHVEPLEPTTRMVQDPVKAHLVDGRTVVFREGVTFVADTVFGSGVAYDLSLDESMTVFSIALDSVAAMEVFDGGTNVPASVVGSVALTGAVLVAAAAAAVAIFGSCPTVYANPADLEAQAELFSYSIAPQFAATDRDLLRIAPDGDGMLRLTIKNEALETHYIDHVRLLGLPHVGGRRIVTSTDDDPLALLETVPAAAAVDRAGRDQRRVLGERDRIATEADENLLASASSEDPEDWIELEFSLPRGEARPDSVVLALRARNSLLSTVLFYDVMLADQGVDAVRWLASDIGEPSAALGLFMWTRNQLGLRVEVWDGGRFRRAGYVADTGPIAWDDIGVAFPVLEEDQVRVRVSFLADSWRIDQAELATRWARIPTRDIPLVAVIDGDGRRHIEAERALHADDDLHLVSRPGESVELVYAADPASGDRPYLLEASGYYTEWIRGDWLRRPTRAFVPGGGAIDRTLRRWRTSRDSLETEFFRRRVPAR